MKHVPEFTGKYHEPFVGGGAVFSAIYHSRSGFGLHVVLNDANAELMNFYGVVRKHPLQLINGLQAIKHSKLTYYRIRSETPRGQIDRAVRFGYLNKTCFNGLWRVNASGEFNVPIGSYKNPTIVEPEIIEDWHKSLSVCDLFTGDFSYRLADVRPRDFVYCDPPYLPKSKTADFTSYTADKFSMKDHERLADGLGNVHKRGAKFLCSQGDSDAIRQLYKQFNIVPVSVQHSVGASAASRGKVSELLIKNF